MNQVISAIEWDFESFPPETRDRLRQIQMLKDGWFYGHGLAPTRETFTRSVFLALAMHRYDCEPEIFPGEHGEILVSGRCHGHILNFTFELGALQLEIDDEPQEINPKADPVRIFMLFIKRFLQCSFYDSFIHFGGAKEITSSSISHSSHRVHKTGEEFQLSIRNAHRMVTGSSVLTWKNFTVRNLPIRSSTGDSIA